MKYAINAARVPDAPGPYSQGTTAGRLAFTSGQLGWSPTDPERLVEGGVVAQAERIFEIFADLLDECGCSLADVAQIHVFLRDMGDLPAVDEVFERRRPKPSPARSIVEVSRLPLDALIEMDCVACR